MRSTSCPGPLAAANPTRSTPHHRFNASNFLFLPLNRHCRTQLRKKKVQYEGTVTPATCPQYSAFPLPNTIYSLHSLSQPKQHRQRRAQYPTSESNNQIPQHNTARYTEKKQATHRHRQGKSYTQIHTAPALRDCNNSGTSRGIIRGEGKKCATAPIIKACIVK